jgi:hypothetical protein
MRHSVAVEEKLDHTMNNTSNSNPSQPGNCVLEPLCSAFHEGAQQARAAAEKAVPKVKAVLSGVTYWLGYGASFAGVFSYTLARELAPEAFKTGCRAGAHSGQTTAEALATKFRHRDGTTTQTPPADPSEATA